MDTGWQGAGKKLTNCVGVFSIHFWERGGEWAPLTERLWWGRQVLLVKSWYQLVPMVVGSLSALDPDYELQTCFPLPQAMWSSGVSVPVFLLPGA